jgi:peroxiredoxin
MIPGSTLPFELLDDAGLKFSRAPRLPTFAVEGMTVIKWPILLADAGRIRQVFDPVFQTDRHAGDVAARFRRHGY